MNGLWWLLLGLLAGWLIELVIDYRYWRRQARITASRLAEQEAALDARSQSLDQRQTEQDLRNEELTALQSSLAARDAELLGVAKRIDERADEVTRLEQAMDKRRADLERMGVTLNEREKDIAARDGKLKAGEADYASRYDRLQAGEADVSRRLAVVSNRESALQNWESRILAREHELGDKEADLVREAAAAAELRTDLAAMKQLVARQYKTADGEDDLEAIEGIGEKVARLLREADIRTFERLSETSLGELTRVLEAGGPRLGLADPLTWAEQAACLMSGDYIAFERMRRELTGGHGHDPALMDEAAGQATGVPGDGEPVAAHAVAAPAAASGETAAVAGEADAGDPGDPRDSGDSREGPGRGEGGHPGDASGADHAAQPVQAVPAAEVAHLGRGAGSPAEEVAAVRIDDDRRRRDS